MREIFPYEKGYWYPHMKPRDIAIWERFIEKYPAIYEKVQYDFHVGDPPAFDTKMDDGTDANQHMLYQLKIDVLGHVPARIDIIEVKPEANAATIGQVQGYRALYLRDEKPAQNVGLVIVTDVEKPNMAFLCQSAGVTLYVV